MKTSKLKPSPDFPGKWILLLPEPELPSYLMYSTLIECLSVAQWYGYPVDLSEAGQFFTPSS